MLLVTIDGIECKVIAKGISLGNAPKIGEPSLIINSNRRVNDWQFNLSGIELDKGEYWFQVVRDGQFIWSHGLVDETGKILQIG